MILSLPYLSSIPDGVRLQIQAQPNAPKNQVVGLHGDALKIKVKAPPEDGRANAELEAFLAKLFGVAKSSVAVKVGTSSRRKQVIVKGVSLQAAEALLAQWK